MCDPVTIGVTMGTLQAGQEYAKSIAYRKQARAYNRSQDEAYDITRENTGRAFDLRIRQSALEESVASARTAQEVQAIERNYLQVTGSAQVATSEAGIAGGGTSKDVAATFRTQRTESLAVSRLNLDTERVSIGNEIVAARLQAEQTNLQARPNYVATSQGVLGGIFRTLNAGVGSYFAAKGPVQ